MIYPIILLRIGSHNAFEKFSAPRHLVKVVVLSPGEAAAKRAEQEENRRTAAIIRASRARRKSGFEHFLDGLNDIGRTMRNIARIQKDLDEFRERVRKLDVARRSAKQLAPLYEAGKKLFARSRAWVSSLLPDEPEQR